MGPNARPAIPKMVDAYTTKILISALNRSVKLPNATVAGMAADMPGKNLPMKTPAIRRGAATMTEETPNTVAAII